MMSPGSHATASTRSARDLELVPLEQWYPKQAVREAAISDAELAKAAAAVAVHDSVEFWEGASVAAKGLLPREACPFDPSSPQASAWLRGFDARVRAGPNPLVPSLQERITSLSLALTQARDTLERYRDPLVKVLDRVLDK